MLNVEESNQFPSMKLHRLIMAKYFFLAKLSPIYYSCHQLRLFPALPQRLYPIPHPVALLSMVPFEKNPPSFHLKIEMLPWTLIVNWLKMMYGMHKRNKRDNKLYKLVVHPADKGGAIVLQRTSDYESEMLGQLRDSVFNQKLPYDPTQRLKLQVHSRLSYQLENGEFDTFELLNVNHPIIPVYYTSPKIDKGQIK